MKNINHLKIDGELLLTLITVYEEQSVVKAAEALNQSQSSISHRLERLRSLIGDPLFVRAGRSIVPTQGVESFIENARVALEQMKLLTEEKQLDLSTLDDQFVVAATDYERATFLLDAYKEILRKAPNIGIGLMWESFENAEALRKKFYDLAISPLPANDKTDLYQRYMFSETISCFYCPDSQNKPDTLQAYLNSKHVRVMFHKNDSSIVDSSLDRIGKTRKVAIEMPSINELPALMRGTDLVATLPSQLKYSTMKEFACCDVPFTFEPLKYYMIWHQRTHNSPKHIWLREQIFSAARNHMQSGDVSDKR